MADRGTVTMQQDILLTNVTLDELLTEPVSYFLKDKLRRYYVQEVDMKRSIYECRRVQAGPYYHVSEKITWIRHRIENV